MRSPALRSASIRVGVLRLLFLPEQGRGEADSVGFRRLLVKRSKGFKLVTGSELLIDSVLLQGANGVVPGVCNVAPEWGGELYDHGQDGRTEETVETLYLLGEQDRIVRSAGSGFLAAAEVKPGMRVPSGAVLCVAENVDLAASERKQLAETERLRMQWRQEGRDQPEAALRTLQRLRRA